MPDQGQVYLQGQLSSRIGTSSRYEESVPCLMVEKIEWDSGFRGTPLQVGDRIVAINGRSVVDVAAELKARKNPSMIIGQYAESYDWAEKKAPEGTPLHLSIRRRQEPRGWITLEAHGTLRDTRSYRDANNSPTLWPGGPNNYERDGFYDTWPTWYENMQKSLMSALVDRWRRSSFVTRSELKTLLEQAPRIELLRTKYPGPFADAMIADYQLAVASTQGRLYTLTDEDLAYRRADDERIESLAALGREQLKAACDAVTLLPAFPAPHPIHSHQEARVGQYVLLEDIPTHKWVNDGDLSFLLAGNDSDGWYSVSIDAAPAQRMFTALRRYQKRVDPNIDANHTVLARIIPEARIVVFAGEGRWCWQVEPVAGWIGNAMFVDLTKQQNGVSLFAGEEGLLKPHTAVPSEDASPEAVLEAMISAIKAGDLTVWRQLFATWDLRFSDKGQPEIRYNVWSVSDSDFEASRRSFSTRLYDARVCWLDDVQVITRGDEFPGAPRLEQVEAEIEDIGFYDNEYRAFNDVTVRRVWTLQRLNGSPWRISSIQHI